MCLTVRLIPLRPSMISAVRLCGGVVTQRIANPCTPVRFRPEPPLISSNFLEFNATRDGGVYSSVYTFAHVSFPFAVASLTRISSDLSDETLA